MRLLVMLVILSWIVLGGIFSCTTSHSAVRTNTSISYALRPCSTCREIVYSTEALCRQAAFDKANEVGATRTTGSAVYTCITRFNVVASFYAPEPPPVNQAKLTWTYTIGTALAAEGFRIVYGTSPEALVNTVQLNGITLSTYTIQNLAPGTYYFAIKSFAGGNESALSNIVTKTVL